MSKYRLAAHFGTPFRVFLVPCLRLGMCLDREQAGMPKYRLAAHFGTPFRVFLVPWRASASVLDKSEIIVKSVIKKTHA